MSPLTTVTVAAMEMPQSGGQYLFIKASLGASRYTRIVPVVPYVPPEETRC